MEKENYFIWYMNVNYKNLLSKQRTYAAFNDSIKSTEGWKHIDIFLELTDGFTDCVFDPMAGYGTLMKYGITNHVNTVMAELNLPAHLWQMFTLPKYNSELQNAVKKLLSYHDYPKIESDFEVTNDLIGQQGLDLLIQLYETNKCILSSSMNENIVIIEKLALAILLPFVMRLSSAEKGDMMHIKNGGVAIYLNYLDDYKYYLENILLVQLGNLKNKEQLSLFQTKHECIYADSSYHDFGDRRFTHMFTSPPYPNGADYGKMFLVENYFLKRLQELKLYSFDFISNPIIGTNTVSGREPVDLISNVAKNFLTELEMLKLKKNQKYDMQVYYLPFFKNYFCDMERAYMNISKFLAQDFLGYIIVTNNSVRKKEIPVAEFIMELWRYLGFNAEDAKQRELTHIGTKNPSTKGKKNALYTEHVIKIWRGNNG